jgi:hypothetical protein
MQKGYQELSHLTWIKNEKMVGVGKKKKNKK